jgi:tetratricopeptide (TPR) repeat protein
VVTETARFEREEQRVLPRTRPVLWWLAAAAAVALFAIIAGPLLRWNQSRRSPMARLIAAAPREHRTVDALLAGFPWARLQAPSRGNAPPDPAEMKFIGAAGEVLEKTNNTAESRHAAGLAYLLTGRRPEAISALEQAASGSSDARVWSDLAAARLAVAVYDKHPAQLPEALADADRAIRLDPKLPEAYYNRALIIEHLELREQARKAWQRYLDLDGGSQWAAEARLHLRSLESSSERFNLEMLDAVPADQLVRRFPLESRVQGEGLLLAQWADAEAAGDSAGASSRRARPRTCTTGRKRNSPPNSWAATIICRVRSRKSSTGERC